MDAERFRENMQNFLKNQTTMSAEDVAKYQGKHVAWSPDGSRIVASGEDLVSLERKLAGTSYDPEECVFSYVPLPNEVFLGGAGM